MASPYTNKIVKLKGCETKDGRGLVAIYKSINPSARQSDISFRTG